MADAVIGIPDRFEQPPQNERADQRYARERRANFQVLDQRRLQTKHRKHQNLRNHGHAIPDNDIGDRLDQ